MDLPQLHLPEAGVYLAAVMFYPRTPAVHRPFVEAVRNEAGRNVLSKNKDKEIRHDVMPLVREIAAGSRLRDVLVEHPPQVISPTYRYIRPEVAVRLFCYVLSCAGVSDTSEPPTLEHAREVIGTAGGKYAGGLPGLGRSQLIEIWQDFSPSVHLLMAKAVLSDLWQQRPRHASGAPSLVAILSYAEALRRRGEQHRPPRSRTTLLDPTETWKAPDWVILPERPEDLAFPTPAALKEEMGIWPRP